MPAPTNQSIELPPELQKYRRISVKLAAEIKGISEDTFKRHYGHLIEKTSPRRRTVQLGKVLDD
jgi:hypothetical protein